MTRARGVCRALLCAALALAAAARPAAADAPREVDTAIVLAVDVSGSVNAARFALQMEGIAQAFRDPAVQGAILGGRHGAVLVALVNWSNKPLVSIPWTLIASAADADSFADLVRLAPRSDEQFTCMATMLQLVADKLLPQMPATAGRTVIDVSGDGQDNCNPKSPVDSLRDELVEAGVTINGLPILEGEQAGTLEQWYEEHVIGGPLSFTLPALGYGDFGRAMRQKFIIEISGVAPQELRRRWAVPQLP